MGEKSSIQVKSPETAGHKPVISVQGAFEIFIEEGKEPIRENLNTLTRFGRLLQPGAIFPTIEGIERPDGQVLVINVVNAFGTPTCDECTTEVERLSTEHGIPVVSVNKETSETGIKLEDDEVEKKITHPRVSINRETAIDLGVELEPGIDADPEFWSTALRRIVVVVGRDGKVVHIQHPNDQEEKPNFKLAFQAAQEALAI